MQCSWKCVKANKGAAATAAGPCRPVLVRTSTFTGEAIKLKSAKATKFQMDKELKGALNESNNWCILVKDLL